MLCQKCNKREATTHLSENINGVKKERHLCSECAAEEGIDMSFPTFDFGNFDFGFGSLLSSFFGNEERGLPNEKKCPTCGRTLSEISRTGNVGCPDCYTTFEKELRPMLLKVHKGDNHKGSVPHSSPEKKVSTDDLKEELKAAIEREDFEKAAVLRDKIREEEGKNE